MMAIMTVGRCKNDFIFRCLMYGADDGVVDVSNNVVVDGTNDGLLDGSRDDVDDVFVEKIVKTFVTTSSVTRSLGNM